MDNLQTVLLECEYFPCIAWYEQFLQSEKIIIEKFEYFERASLRNRCFVAGPNGKLALTVPLEGGRNQKTLMNEIKISYQESWQMLHWKTLQTCYNRSPYFEFYKDDLFRLFEKKYTYLIDLNLETLLAINKLLHIKKEFGITENYQAMYESNIIDCRKLFDVKNHTVSKHIKYIQTFEAKHEFIKGLSMLDMLFCVGKQANELLLKV